MSGWYLGLDVGGTKVAAAAVSITGEVRGKRRVETAEIRTSGDVMAALVGLGRAVLVDADCGAIAGVGIALPGPCDHRDIRMLAAPTIPEIQNLALKPLLEHAFGCPAAGDNDANACALAEARFGAAQGHELSVYLTVSTGIGGGIVHHGRVFRGVTGTSGEFGHQVILPVGGPPCDCGSTGCLEALASGRGIARRMQAATGDSHWTADAVAAAARAGDVIAQQVWRDTALYLGLGIANIVNVLDPGVVVLGGGVSLGAADLLLAGIREVERQRCMPSLGRETPIVTAALGEDLGVISAAVLAMRHE